MPTNLIEQAVSTENLLNTVKQILRWSKEESTLKRKWLVHVEKVTKNRKGVIRAIVTK